jgi:hypothetical protein
LSDIFPSTHRGADQIWQPQPIFIATIMRRGAIPGQGGNVCDLGRLGGPSSCPKSISGQNRDHFRVFEEAEINVIARMAPMTGIQQP